MVEYEVPGAADGTEVVRRHTALTNRVTYRLRLCNLQAIKLGRDTTMLEAIALIVSNLGISPQCWLRGGFCDGRHGSYSTRSGSN